MMRALASLSLVLTASAAPVSAQPAIHQPPFGSNPVFTEEAHAAPGHELIVADLNLPPNAVGEAHWHEWEEYLYVLGGSAVLDIDGMEPRELGPGESFVIPRRTVHTPRAGAQGIRAIVIRVHDAGDPVSTPAAERMPPQ